MSHPDPLYDPIVEIERANQEAALARERYYDENEPNEDEIEREETVSDVARPTDKEQVGESVGGDISLDG